jgi:CO/xanthine dehydrogenase Mo-binding subunit
MTTDRRDFLKTSGMLVVGFVWRPAFSGAEAHSAKAAAGPTLAQTPAAGPYPDPDFHQLDSWIVIRPDNTATFYVGKTDLGQGTGTAFRQIMSDELDIAFDKTAVVMGNTDVTVDQGGSGGSDALQTDGWPMRRVAAEARRVLLEMAAARFAVPVDQLTVSNAVISVKQPGTERAQTSPQAPSPTVTYGELIGGKRFNVVLTGNNVDATTGQAKLKAVQDMKMTANRRSATTFPARLTDRRNGRWTSSCPAWCTRGTSSRRSPARR